jgi:hypothetical protein
MNSQGGSLYDIYNGDILRCSNYRLNPGLIVGGRVDKGTQFVTYMASFKAQHSQHIYTQTTFLKLFRVQKANLGRDNNARIRFLRFEIDHLIVCK